MINRAALILRYKQPAIDWINEVDPHDDGPKIVLEDVNRERTVYLIPDRAADDDETVRNWIEFNYKELMENELGGWYTDESLLPKSFSLEMFDDWFHAECHSMIIDTSDDPIVDEYDDEIG
jgi:hypothetical protein